MYRCVAIQHPPLCATRRADPLSIYGNMHLMRFGETRPVGDRADGRAVARNEAGRNGARRAIRSVLRYYVTTPASNCTRAIADDLRRDGRFTTALSLSFSLGGIDETQNDNQRAPHRDVRRTLFFNAAKRRTTPTETTTYHALLPDSPRFSVHPVYPSPILV